MTDNNTVDITETENPRDSEHKGHHVLDDELIEMLEDTPTEDPILTKYGGSGNTDGVREVRDWLPDSADYKGKTFISPEQAKAMAVLRHYNLFVGDDMGEEVNKIFELVLNDFERYLTSMHGMSREEQVSVLTGMFGKPKEGENDGGTTVNLLADKE